jgi:hypothetical protein
MRDQDLDFAVCYTCDDSGQPYPEPQTLKPFPLLLREAVETVEQLAREGRGAGLFVRRLSDGKALCPDGTWA